MPDRTSYPEGTPSWTDLMTTDVDGAKAFYGELFGWDFADEPTDQPGVTYTMCTTGGKAAAGMGAQNPEQAAQGIPPLWTSYVSVDDVEATVAKVQPAGGSVMVPPMDVMTFGRMAVVVDPTGAVLALWQPKDHIGAEVVNEHGTLTWTELLTPDVDAALAFYGEVLGWTAETADMGGFAYTTVSVGDRGVAGAMTTPMEGMPPMWGVYFAVDDFDAAAARAKDLGAQQVMDAVDGPPGRFATFLDPQGAAFSMIQLAQQPD